MALVVGEVIVTVGEAVSEIAVLADKVRLPKFTVVLGLRPLTPLFQETKLSRPAPSSSSLIWMSRPRVLPAAEVTPRLDQGMASSTV